MPAERLRRLHQVIARDPGGRRGIAPLAAATADGLSDLAHAIAHHPAPSVALITGFYLSHGEPPACETDGPIGAAHLAAGLTAAGTPCRVATDAPNAGAVAAAITAAGVAAQVPIDIVAHAPFPGGKPLDQVVAGWRANPPSHVISIERCGPAADGVPRRADGTPMADVNAPLHELFHAGEWTTAAFGDGGNELGMGALELELLHAHVPDAANIACAISCDHLVVAGVSNWAAQALLCALATLWPDRAAPLTANLTAETGRYILDQTVRHGPAVAMTEWPATQAPRPASHVDGLPWADHAAVIADLVACLEP